MYAIAVDEVTFSVVHRSGIVRNILKTEEKFLKTGGTQGDGDDDGDDDDDDDDDDDGDDGDDDDMFCRVRNWSRSDILQR